MASPSFSTLNGQVKTAWRWYDAFRKLAEFQPSCLETEEGFKPMSVLSAPDSLPPFQFVRPTSLAAIDTWKLYDNDGVEVLDLSSNIGLLAVERFATLDYVIYDGSVLDTVLPAGFYYSRITTDGATYYSEPVRVVCTTEGENCYLDPWKSNTFYSTLNNPTGGITLSPPSAVVVTDVIPAPGAPGSPGDFVGERRANTADSFMYEWDGAAWNASAPAVGSIWWWLAGGMFLTRTNSTYTAGNQPIYTSAAYGVSAQGLLSAQSSVLFTTQGLPCECATAGPVRIKVTIADYAGGSAALTASGYTGTPIPITADGDYSIVVPLIPAFGNIEVQMSGDFSGSIVGLEVFCQGNTSDCYRRLEWGNCGNVGNTYMADGFMDSLWLDLAAHPMLPTPTQRVETEEQADGTLVETFRRKEVRYSIRLGLLPWPVADALSDMQLMDTVRLHHTSGDAYDTLRDVKVTVTYDEAVSECMPVVEVEFAIDNAAVACCDDFDRACEEPCTTADGFDTLIDDETGVYVDDDAPRYGNFTDGELQGNWTTCTSGSVNIRVLDIGALDSANRNIDTHLWNVGLSAWVRLALITDVTNTLVGSSCEVVVVATIQSGYSGTLQYWSNSEQRWIDTDLTLTSSEWATNTVAWTHLLDALYVRLKVTVGDCVVGYSQAYEGTLGCA